MALISDIYVGMGTDLANVEDNKFVIYTHDDLKYNLSDNDSSNQKELGLIWYNKDENNKYIGFSDGRVRNDVNGGLTINPKDENSLKYIDYDEIEYLSNQSIINRLTAQQGRYDVPDTKEGLWLAADLSELEPLLKSIKTVVYSDLFAEFNKFNIRLGALNEDDDIVNLFNTWIGDSGHFYNTETFENNVKGMIDYYKDGLEYAAAVQRNGVKDGEVSEMQIQEDGTEKEKIFTQPKGNLATYENALVGPIRGSSKQGILTFIIDQITNEKIKDKNNITVAFLPRLKEILIDKYSSFLGAYDAYESRILEVIKNLQKLITEFKDLVFERQLPSGETDVSNVKKFSQLLSYTNKEQFKKYTAPDMSIYDNLYCVYWYKYQSGYTDEDDPFGRRDWQRIETDSPNIGLPTPHPEDAKNVDIKFYPAKPLDTDAHALLNLTLPVDNKEEKYKAVLIYNHEPFNSNEIVFTNERYVTDEEIKNNIKIEHGDNSQDHYPLYGIDNVLIDATAYNRPRHLRLRYCNEKGDFDDSYLANASIYWYIPLNSTMLRYDLNDLGDIKDDDSEVISKGFTNDLPTTDEDGNIISNEIVDEFHRDGYAYFYKKVTATEDEDGNVKINSQDRYFTYRIKDYYNPTNTQNTIYCVIVKGQAKFETQIDLTFSTFGSNGTDYTLKISPLTSQIGVGGDSGSEEGAMPFKFKIALYDYNNEQVNITSGNDSSAAAGTAILSSVSIEGPNSVIKEYDANSDLTFENDGTVTGSVILEKKNPPCYYRVLTASVKIKWTGPDGKELDETKQGRTVELSTYYIIPYTPHLGYYVEGPTTVVYDSQGNNPSYYKNPFKLFENTNVLSKQNEELQGVESKEVPNTKWSIIYYDATGTEVNYNKLDDESKKHYKLLMSYMPKLASDNTLVPCNMYLSIDEPIDDQKETLYNLYPTVLCKQAGTIIWAQPIYLMQNRYPSAMLNAWDGKLQIDEENGTILSNLVGAGKKNIDNSFSGVLMGEIESKTGISIEGTNSLERSLAQNQTGIGLYGFHEGAQSFGFNINGTAFLGKSGGGRISFDGNHGFIYSGAWLNSFKKYQVYENKEDILYPDDYQVIDGKKQYWTGQYNTPFLINNETSNISLKQGRAGMAIDLQDGHIDAFNFRLTSNNIYLNSSPDDTDYDKYYFRIGHNGKIKNPYTGGTPAETNGYFFMDKDGNVSLKVNNLSITSYDTIMGNYNLLRNSAPLKISSQQNNNNDNANDGDELSIIITKTWDLNPWRPKSQGEDESWATVEIQLEDSSGKILAYDENSGDIASTNVNKDSVFYITSYLQQTMPEMIANEIHTASGYIKLAKDKEIKIRIYSKNDDDSYTTIKEHLIVGTGKWQLFTFNFDKGQPNDIIRYGDKNGSQEFYLWHPKVETGPVATEWTLHPSEIVSSTAVDSYIIQESNNIRLGVDSKFQHYTDTVGMKSAISIKASDIYSNVGKQVQRYDTRELTKDIKYYGFGTPYQDSDDDMYIAASSCELDDYYLDQNTGDVYRIIKENGKKKWRQFITLPSILITELSTLMSQNSDNISLMAATATYYGECSTGSNENRKEIRIKNPDGLKRATTDFVNGVSLIVNFSEGSEYANNSNDITLALYEENNGKLIPLTYQKDTENTSKYGEYKVYYLGSPLKPNDKTERSWGQNSSVLFTYDGRHWNKNDNGSYTQFTIANDRISSFVQGLEYYGVCDTAADVTTKEIVLSNTHASEYPGAKDGTTLSVRFANGNSAPSGLKFKIKKSDTDSGVETKVYLIDQTNTLEKYKLYNWGAQTTMNFIYRDTDTDPGWYIYNTNLYSSIIQTSSSIISTVQAENSTFQEQTANSLSSLALAAEYYGKCETSADKPTKVVELVSSTDFAYKEGLTLGVNFLEGNDCTDFKIKVVGNDAAKKVSSESKYNRGQIVIFKYVQGQWVAQSGTLYSYIEQTVNGMSITANEFILKNTEGIEYVRFSGNKSNKPKALIGDWSIDYRSISKTYLTEAKDREYYTGMYSVWPSTHKHTIAGYESGNWRFVVGSRTTPSKLDEDIAKDPTIPGGYDFKFGVTREGYLAAENAYIDGRLYIKGGNISGSLYIESTGEIILSGAGTGVKLNSTGIYAVNAGNQLFKGIKFQSDGNVLLNYADLNHIVLGSTVVTGDPSTSTKYTGQVYIGNTNCTLEDYINYIINNKTGNPWNDKKEIKDYENDK